MVTLGRRPVSAASSSAVLLLAYGGPDSLRDVEPFLRDIRAGRETPDELVREVTARYAAIGGGSPLARKTREQAAALETALRAAGDPRPVHVGMRHWEPRIADTVSSLAQEGVHHLTAVCLAPHYSHLSIGAYRSALEHALEECGARFDVTFVDHWGDHPLLIRALASRIETAIGTEPYRLDETELVFTAHSLPASVVDQGDPYVSELHRTAAAVAELLGTIRYHLAFQSAGARAVRWLGPDLLETLNLLRASGSRHVLVSPIGFVSDHVEILYDLDIEARRVADDLGLSWRRPEALNTHPDFIAALVDLVRNPEPWKLSAA